MLIDSHCHLDFPELSAELGGVLARAREAGVGLMVTRTPTFTPMTVRPEILNAAEIVQEMQRVYPPILREAGVEGTVLVSFLVDETGQVRNVALDRTSGYEPLDQAALRVARLYRFSPAQNRESVVPVWIALPLTFRLTPR
jgi:TonB family protein